MRSISQSPRLVSPLAVALLLLGSLREAHAEPPEVRWSPDYRSFGAVDAAVTGAAITGAGAFLLTSPQNREPRWTGGILFDDGARDALRLSSPRGREAAQEVGTRLYFGALAFPFLDAAGSALAVHRRPEVAAQMALIDTEVFALVGLLNFGLTNVVARQRPFVRSCAAGDDPVFPRCGESGRDYQSFFGGHAAVSFAAAGLTCAHHQNLPLYGGGAPDVLVCAGLVANGVAVAWTRMMADKHYFSDNLVGAAIGFSLGYGVPTFFHYRRTQPTPTRGLGVVAVPLVSRAQAGVAVSGAF